MGPWLIPEGFERLVSDHLRATRGSDEHGIGAGDFPAGQSVRIRFVDGSVAEYNFAFTVRDDRRQLVAVFTEHCGYHVFSRHDATFEVLQRIDVVPVVDE